MMSFMMSFMMTSLYYIPLSACSLVYKLSGSISSFCKNLLSLFNDTLACTILEIKFGSMDNGNRRILNNDNATKALSAVSGSSLVATNVPNVARAT